MPRGSALQVLLIHDPKTEFAASSLSVSVGSFADPKNLQGAFHFLEHLLFMGTERYPDENDYSAYLADHGGYSNAWTAGEETC
jgi:insulysin